VTGGPQGNLQRMWWERNALAFVRPYHADARSASLRENRPPPIPGAFPGRPSPRRMVHPVEGRAPHARDDGITPTPMFPPFGHRPVANSSIIATWLGSPPALPPGRGDRAPPRKSPFASFPALPRKAILPWMALPAEGRAPHARKARLRRLLEVHWTRRAEPSVPTGIALGARSRY